MSLPTQGSQKAMEVFPDLHHKMSKKIAQLTKVIYHLNTKNEDHALEVETLAANHQMEIQQILRDAANRINKFKEVIDAKQAAASQDVKVEKLTKKHEAEKAQAMQELAAMKQKITEREAKIAADFQTKYDLLRREVDTMNKKFAERISLFESANAELKKSVDDAMSSGTAGLDELRKRHEKEVAEVVRTSNDKYNALLIEQLAAQETLKKEYALMLEKELRSAAEKHKQEMERESGQIRAKLSAEAQEKLLTLRHELEDALTEAKTTHAQKMDSLLADLKKKNKEIEELQTRLSAQEAQWLKEREQLQSSFASASGDSAQAMNQLNESLQSLREQLTQTQAKVAVQKDELSSQSALLTAKNARIVELETLSQQLQEKISSLEKLVQDSSQRSSQSDAEFAQRLAQLEEQKESYRKEINGLAAQMLALREEMKAKDKVSATTIGDLQSEITLLQKQLAEAQAQCKDMLNQSSSGQAKAQSEIDALQRQLQAAREEGIALENKRIAKEEDILRNHREEMASTLRQQEEIRKQLSVDHEKAIALLHKEIEHSKQQLSRMEDSSQETVKKQQEREAELRSQLEELTQQLAAQQEANDRERQKMSADYSKLESKYKALSKELDSRKGDNDRFESLTSSLKTQIENLREELKASQKAFREKLDLDAQRLSVDFNRQIDELNAKHADEQAKIEQEWQAKHEKAMQSLREEHDEAMKAMKAILQKEVSDAANDLKTNERLREQLEALLQSERQTHAQQLSDALAKHSKESKDHLEANRLEIERLKREWKSTLESRESQWQLQQKADSDKHSQQLSDLKESHRVELHNALQSAQQSAATHLAKQLSDLEDKLRQEGRKEREELSQLHDKAQQLAQEAHARECQALSQQLLETQRGLHDAKSQIAALQDIVNQERQVRSNREQEFLVEKDGMLREHQQQLQSQQSEHEKQSVAIIRKAEEDLANSKRDMGQQKEAYEDRIREIVKEYKALETKYLNRESRPEDLARIDHLEQEVISKEEAMKKIEEDMQYLKRELINREENYNQKFSRQPNVGVMQVIKPKEPPTADGRAKPTQMRVINPQGGNLNMNGLGAGLPGNNNTASGLGIGTKLQSKSSK